MATCDKGHTYVVGRGCPECEKIRKTPYYKKRRELHKFKSGDANRKKKQPDETNYRVKQMLEKVGPPLYGCI